MNRNILVFSSNFDNENGQAVVTRRVVKFILPKIGGGIVCIYQSGASLSSVLSWLVACLKMFLAIITFEVQTIYIVCSRTSLGFLRDFPGLCMAFLGKRVVVHCHGSDLNKLFTTGWFSNVVRFVYRRCEVIVPCAVIKDQIIDKVGKVYICENFFDEHFSEVPDIQDVSRLFVIWNSNIMASKGFLDVIAAIDILNSDGVPIQILAFGNLIEDCEMSEVEMRIHLEKFQKKQWFEYIGIVDHEQAIKRLQRADVVILPSRYVSEMQPLAVIEGMCSAKRIVVSNTASLRMTVGDYPANFVPINDVEAIVECLAKLHREKISLGSEFAIQTAVAAEKARSRFSTVRFDSDIESIIQPIKC